MAFHIDKAAQICRCSPFARHLLAIALHIMHLWSTVNMCIAYCGNLSKQLCNNINERTFFVVVVVSNIPLRISSLKVL